MVAFHTLVGIGLFSKKNVHWQKGSSLRFQRVPDGLSDLYFKIIQSNSLFFVSEQCACCFPTQNKFNVGATNQKGSHFTWGKMDQNNLLWISCTTRKLLWNHKGGSKLHYIKSMIIKNKGSISFKIVVWNTFIIRKYNQKVNLKIFLQLW